MEVADGKIVPSTVFMAEMYIPELKFHQIVEIYAIEMKEPSSRVLLGRSFLKDYIVTYNGREERFHYFHNPPVEIDYGMWDDG
jgi:hypothetical protein